jgi:hypothetical protein
MAGESVQTVRHLGPQGEAMPGGGQPRTDDDTANVFPTWLQQGLPMPFWGGEAPRTSAIRTL